MQSDFGICYTHMANCILSHDVILLKYRCLKNCKIFRRQSNKFFFRSGCNDIFIWAKAEYAEKSSPNCECHNKKHEINKLFLQNSDCGVIFLKPSDQTAQTFSGIIIYDNLIFIQ